MMNKYRVTFIASEGLEQRTILSAANLPGLIRKVENMIQDPAGYFTNDKKNNTYFRVMKENIAYIQYELLFSNKEMNIERIKHVSPAIIRSLVERANNAELYAFALVDIDQETRDFLMKEMLPDFRNEVEQLMKSIKETSSMEIYKAQELLLDELIQLMNQ